MTNLSPLPLIPAASSQGDEPALVDCYQAMFEALPATTPRLREAALRLRYQVYCIERGFEDAAAFPDGMESDEYDRDSVHGLLLHRVTGDVAGTVRLVLPRPDGGCRLPIHSVCRGPAAELLNQLPSRRIAEISRFAVSRVARPGASDSSGEAVDLGLGPQRRILPYITLGLIAHAVQATRAFGIEYICAVMEPGLLRLLSRFGIHFAPLGPLVEYHGIRQPCVAEIRELIARVEEERPDVWEVITDRGACLPTRYRSQRRRRAAELDVVPPLASIVGRLGSAQEHYQAA